MYCKFWEKTLVNLEYYTWKTIHEIWRSKKYYDKNRLNEFMTTKPALQRLLEGTFQSEDKEIKDKHIQEVTKNKQIIQESSSKEV